MLTSGQISQLLVAIADSRDGIAIYKVTEKMQSNIGKLSGKAKIKLVAVTPFGEGLNPMAFSVLTTTSLS